MSIFDLHATVLTDYRDFVRSFFDIADPRARAFIDHALEDERHLWPDFLLQVSPSYPRVETVDDLARRGVLHEETARVFRNKDGSPVHLFRHQSDALRRALSQESYVVTSGTGSGKSLTYFLPIIDNLIRNPHTADRVAAFLVYPMNALVNSQLNDLTERKKQYEARYGRPFPVSFAKYTGDTSETDRMASLLKQGMPCRIAEDDLRRGILAQWQAIRFGTDNLLDGLAERKAHLPQPSRMQVRPHQRLIRQIEPWRTHAAGDHLIPVPEVPLVMAVDGTAIGEDQTRLALAARSAAPLDIVRRRRRYVPEVHEIKVGDIDAKLHGRRADEIR